MIFVSFDVVGVGGLGAAGFAGFVVGSFADDGFGASGIADGFVVCWSVGRRGAAL